MLSWLKQGSKQLLHSMGIEAHRFHPGTSSLARLMSALNSFGIDLIIDVGANDGQFAIELRSGGYSGHIVSFEPLTSAHEKLLNKSRHDPQWDVHERCALGNSHDEIKINISGNSVSSSILPMLDAHSNAAPESIYQSSESSPQTTLDSVIAPYLEQSHSPLLKIDTQGYEWEVLDGACLTLPKVRGIIMELSLVPLYEGQRLWLESIERLEKEGFELWAMEPVFIDPLNGRTLQVDAMFFRK